MQKQLPSILGPVQPRRVLTRLIDPASTPAPSARSGTHISVPAPSATSNDQDQDQDQEQDPMEHLEDFTQPKKAPEIHASPVYYDNPEDDESNHLENDQDGDPFLDALMKVPDQQKQKSSQPSQHLPSDSDVEEMEPAVAAVSQEITKKLPDLIQNEVNELSENVIQEVQKNDEDDKILNDAVNIISQDVANTMSQVIHELQEKEAEKTGNVPTPNEIIQKFSRYYVVPDDEKIPKPNFDIWAPWDHLMRLYPGLLTLDNAQCDNRLRLFQPGNEERLEKFLNSNNGRWDMFQAFLFIIHYHIVFHREVLKDDQTIDPVVFEPFSPLDLAWLGYSKDESIQSDHPVRIGSTFTRTAWKDLLQAYYKGQKKMRAMDRNFWTLKGDIYLQDWINNLTGIFEGAGQIVTDLVRHAADWRRPCPVPDDVKKQCDSIKKKLILLHEYQQGNIRPVVKEAQKIVMQNSQSSSEEEEEEIKEKRKRKIRIKNYLTSNANPAVNTDVGSLIFREKPPFKKNNSQERLPQRLLKINK